MEFGFLFDPVRKLFSIGYRVADGSLDPGYYDLLASEARLTSFVVIAKGDVPVSHWFRLGRALTPVEQDSVLVSWSGSMFEYLMPALVMRAPAGSLLDQTCQLVVRRQITLRRGARRAVGRLGVRLQRPRPRDDLPVFELRRAGPGAPAGAERRRRRRALCDGAGGHDRSGGRGPKLPASRGGRRQRRLRFLRSSRLHAVPASRERRAWPWCAPTWRTTRACRSSPSTMSSTGGIMRARFHAEPVVQATDLLLQERTPRDVAVARPPAEDLVTARRRAGVRPAGRAALHHAPRSASPHPYPVEWTLRGDGHGRGLRVQPLARHRRDALERGRHPRRGGHLRLPPRCVQRPELVGRLPADRTRAGQLRGGVLRGSGRGSRGGTARSTPPSTCSYLRKTTPRCAGSRS